MIQYIIEVIICQLLFLIVYDFFLKKETFFNWNRVYLLGSVSMSFIIPFIEIKNFKKVVPEEYIVFLSDYVTESSANTENVAASFTLSPWQLVFIVGCILSIAIFIYKCSHIFSIKYQNKKIKYPQFTKIIIKDSNAAFSFFKNIFLGDALIKREHQHIIKHELVHIKQFHSIDLLFFECLRILMWFNPLIYVYQQRISELHEFIADAKVSKGNKKIQYEQLLSEVFKTNQISFINPFFKSSLIKKRILMLQKSKSKKIWQLKYLLIAPVLLSMLIYTSCENNIANDVIDTIEVQELSVTTNDNIEVTRNEAGVILRVTIKNPDLKNLEQYRQLPEVIELSERIEADEKLRLVNSMSYIEGGENTLAFFETLLNDETVKPAGVVEDNRGVHVPFAVIDEVPVFPGCENAPDKRKCFNEKIRAHIQENFEYPEVAKTLGIEGRVSILFTIGPDGNITNIKKRGPDKQLEANAVNIIEKLPQMKPGKQKGKAVSVPFAIPIVYKLH